MQPVEGLAKKGDGRLRGQRSVEAQEASDAQHLVGQHALQPLKDLQHGAGRLALPGGAWNRQPMGRALGKFLNELPRVVSGAPQGRVCTQQGLDLGRRPVGPARPAKLELGPDQRARISHHHRGKGVNQGGFEQAARVASAVLLAGLVELQKDLDPGVGQGQVQRKPHGHVSLFDALGQCLQHGHQKALVTQYHGGLAGHFGTPFLEQCPHRLGDAEVAAGRNDFDLLLTRGPVRGGILKVDRQTLGQATGKVAQGFTGLVHLEVEVVAVGVPKGCGAQVQVGGAQQRFLRRRQGIESGKKEAVDPVARTPVHPLGLGRAAGRGRSAAKLHSGRGHALGPKGLVVGGVEFGKLAPQAQTALHQLGGLFKAPFAEGLDFAQLAQGGVCIRSVAVELAKVAQNGRSPAQKLVQGIRMRPGHLAVCTK